MSENEIIAALKSYSLKTKALFEAINLIECQSKKINKIKEILIEAECIADNQEFGLSYGQAINYLEEIKDIIK